MARFRQTGGRAKATTGCEEIARGLLEAAIPAVERPGCPVSAIRNKLRSCGLRPTRQRVLLGWILFARGHRHVSAEDLFAEATYARAHLSLATVYNTLKQFTEAGLLRLVQAGPGKAWFDTNISDHSHFAVDGEDTVFDVEGQSLQVSAMPEAPPGFAVSGVEVIVRLRRLPAEGTLP
jgi:Fur family transcriptional regulator, iron response regulator